MANPEHVRVVMSEGRELMDRASVTRFDESLDAVRQMPEAAHPVVSHPSAVSQQLTDAQRHRVEQLRGLQARLSRLVLSQDTRDPEAHDAEVAAVRETRDDLQRRLRRSDQSEKVGGVSVSEVRADLPARSAVVDFFVHRV